MAIGIKVTDLERIPANVVNDDVQLHVIKTSSGVNESFKTTIGDFIFNNSITNAKIAPGAVNPSKLSGGGPQWQSNGTVQLGSQASTTSDAVRADRSISTSGIATGGGNLTADRTINVPATNLGTLIVSNNSRSITSSTGDNITVPVATTTVAGFMSHTDKTKLNGIATGAEVNVGTNLGIIAGTTAGPIVTSSTGNNATLPAAANNVSGVVTIGTQTFAGAKTFEATTTINGNLGIRAASTASTTTQIPVFIADPTSTTRTIVTRTPTQLRSDIGAASIGDGIRAWALVQGNPVTILKQSVGSDFSAVTRSEFTFTFIFNMDRRPPDSNYVILVTIAKNAGANTVSQWVIKTQSRDNFTVDARAQELGKTGEPPERLHVAILY